ncbi:hypothetical protein CK203_058152 [Vitis vinifera]|uniref:Uncharacterized protein n=1 Tax=Vitis vinifera TaxID=29760 RepID=A0A438GQF6_VITVI|nr:hypothetical protein CK203_058152 [Vitis vinifera]
MRHVSSGLETALELDIRQMEMFGDSNLILKQIQGDWRTRDVKLRLYHAYLELLVGRFDDLRYTYLLRVSGTYLEAATTKDRRALRKLSARFFICGETLYRGSTDGMLLLCLDRASADRVMREVHVGVCGPHMGGHMLALWGIDIIGKISPKSSNGHEFILVAIDYFTKWVEAASYVRLTFARVASFIRSHIICRYRMPYELISNKGLTPKGAAWLIDLDGNQFSERTNVDQLKKYSMFEIMVIGWVTIISLFDHQSNMRLRRVIWNPWQSNGKLKFMKNQALELHSPLPKSFKELQPFQEDHSKLKEDFCTTARSVFCCENSAAILHSARVFS